jgi:phenylacetate-CoA ligase
MRIWWGVHPSAPRAKVWRTGPMADTRRRQMRHMLAWPSPRIALNASRMDERGILRFLDEWDRVRPQLLIGYVGAMLEVARFLLESGRRVAPPIAIEATAAPVTEAQKAMLSEAFGAPVYDVYQSVEVPVMAGECARRNGLHVFTDNRWLEIVDDEGRPVPPGQPGTVIITDLRNRAFPVIRYRQGDVTSWKVYGCGCDLPFPVLNPVQGRTSDCLHFPSGLVVSGDAVMRIVLSQPHAVRQFQLVQHRDRSITLRCVPSDDPQADAIMRGYAADLAETVRHEVPVRLEVVDVIAHDRGKTRFVIREGSDPVPPQAGPMAIGTTPARTSPLPT